MMFQLRFKHIADRRGDISYVFANVVAARVHAGPGYASGPFLKPISRWGSMWLLASTTEASTSRSGRRSRIQAGSF